jgi:UDP-2,3-diacylglucosamine hydrolase
MTILFVSDLHLSIERPDKVELFKTLLECAAGRVSALYILGDLFEYWLGDDDDSAPNGEVLAALAGFSNSDSQLYVMRGNRDFLIGERFASMTGCTLLSDPTVISLFGRTTLLMHGDLLCTRDHDYQSLRRTVNDPAWQRRVLSKPLAERRVLAAQMRDGSRKHILNRHADIMDVDTDTVCKYMLDYGCRSLIHGHTHRPAEHIFVLAGETAQRTVLGDWYEGDSVLACHDSRQRLLGIREFVSGLDEA